MTFLGTMTTSARMTSRSRRPLWRKCWGLLQMGTPTSSKDNILVVKSSNLHYAMLVLLVARHANIHGYRSLHGRGTSRYDIDKISMTTHHCNFSHLSHQQLPSSPTHPSVCFFHSVRISRHHQLLQWKRPLLPTQEVFGGITQSPPRPAPQGLLLHVPKMISTNNRFGTTTRWSIKLG